jgi:hypothetical protein
MIKHSDVANALFEGSFCASQEEAEVLAEIVLGDLVGEDANNLACCLVEHLAVTVKQANELVSRILRKETANCSSETQHDDPECSEEDVLDAEFDDGEMLLAEGECELCDRCIKLTRHHLIPRSTWPRLQKVLVNAALAKERGDIEKALGKLGPGLEDRLDILTPDKSCIRGLIQSTCDICRACHDTVHRLHPNIELALFYNSINKLLADEQISRFCKWASKQRPRGNQIA